MTMAVALFKHNCSLKRRPTIEFAAYFDNHNLTQNSQTDQTILLYSSQFQPNLSIQNINNNAELERADGKHSGHVHIRQWRGGKVNI